MCTSQSKWWAINQQQLCYDCIPVRHSDYILQNRKNIQCFETSQWITVTKLQTQEEIWGCADKVNNNMKQPACTRHFMTKIICKACSSVLNSFSFSFIHVIFLLFSIVHLLMCSRQSFICTVSIHKKTTQIKPNVNTKANIMKTQLMINPKTLIQW